MGDLHFAVFPSARVTVAWQHEVQNPRMNNAHAHEARRAERLDEISGPVPCRRA